MNQLLQTDKRFLKLATVAVVVLGLALYANTLTNQLFWDDNDFILNNQFIKEWRYLPQLFSENIIAGAGLGSNYWRPLVGVVFSLEWHLWGAWAPGWHLVNILFHTAAAVLLLYLLSTVFGNRWLALAVSLIFVAHPLQTEAVTYVNSLGDSLSVFFILGGALLYLKSRSSSKPPWDNAAYLGALIAYALALMSKETAIIMPAYLLLADFFSQTTSKPLKDRLNAVTRSLWPLVVIAGLYLWLRATALNFGGTFNLYEDENLFTSSPLVRLFTFWRVLIVYLSLLFWPVGLHMERSVELATTLAPADVWLGGLILVSLFTFALIQYRRWREVSFGLFWFLVGLAPVSNLAVPISGLLYEHWLYLPLVGVFTALISFGQRLAKRYQRLLPNSLLTKSLVGLTLVFLVFLATKTVLRNRDWRDPVTFYTQTLPYAPDSYRLINNLGMAYADRGDLAQAEELYQRAITLDPANPVAHHNLGNSQHSRGQLQAAVESFETAIRLDPNFLFSYRALTNLYLEQKNLATARAVLERYLTVSSDQVETWLLLSQLANQQQDLAGSLSYLERALAKDPTNPQLQAAVLEARARVVPGGQSPK